MQINLKTGLLEDAIFIPSPNYNERPENTVIDLLVIHNISLPPGQFGGDEVIKLFTNQLAAMKELQVSAHLFIRRDGQVIQFVPFHLRAWHAGVSSFKGRENCNDFSIGIELEGTDIVAFTKAQYEKLREIIKAIKIAYPAITQDHITGHSDIAPGRKTDPGKSFDWNQINQ